MNYYIWNIGCQMNKAESAEIADYLSSMGMSKVQQARDADIAILNTCVVRQNAEDKVISTLNYLKGFKSAKSLTFIAVSGCFVTENISKLKLRFPMVDFFFKPGDVASFKNWISINIRSHMTTPSMHRLSSVSSYIPIIQGCNNFCSYCIVPYRRGREKSSQPDEILSKANSLVASGVREITLLGQNVNSYGIDLSEKSNLSDLIHTLHKISDLKRIRFLTNHPKDMSGDLIKTIAELPKICHHLCLPLQAGDDEILKAMNRHYSLSDYVSLIEKIRKSVPDIALSTDIIVGFPGESDEQFNNTYEAIRKIGFESVHVAAYSTREGTAASVKYTDSVPQSIKLQRMHIIEKFQKEFSQQRNNKLLGTDVSVLVEGQKDGKWFGRTGSDKLVFFTSADNLMGKLVNVKITFCTPWSLQGDVTKS